MHVEVMEVKMKETEGGIDPDQALAMGAHTVYILCVLIHAREHKHTHTHTHTHTRGADGLMLRFEDSRPSMVQPPPMCHQQVGRHFHEMIIR